jgi:hypothetical protein
MSFSTLPNDVWLNTEQAAQILGYSVPYTAAWLATSEFALAVKTEGGQLVVLESALREWMVRHDVQAPLSKEAM